MDRFEDQTVVVTGSTRGIGASVARRFGREGANVVVNDHGAGDDDGEAVAAAVGEAGGDAVYVQADVRDPDAVAALFEATADEFGGVDVLVNNAAVQSDTAADEVSVAEFDRVVETNLRGYWLCAVHAADHMDGVDGGAVVNVSSNHALQTMPAHFPYNVTKAGIEGLTRAMALDFGPDVRVNSVVPGWVLVDRTAAALDDEERRHVESIHPAGRMGRPADVAGAVAYLASDDAAFVTGTSLVVDGGRTAVLQDDVLPDYANR